MTKTQEKDKQKQNIHNQNQKDRAGISQKNNEKDGLTLKGHIRGKWDGWQFV